MAQITRNSFKGYTFQQQIFTLMLAKMDTDRFIKSIESEADVKENFDDLCIIADKIYRVQVKNYPGVTLDDITITDYIVTIKGNHNNYNKLDNNILIVNTDKIVTDNHFMGFKAKVVNKIIIIPLTSDKVCEELDEMFSNSLRELQIIEFAYKQTAGARFLTTIENLPPLAKMPTNLEQNTIIIREPLSEIDIGITWIIGKPGVGKSHYVNELIEKYKEAIVYRLWIGAQDDNLRRRLSFDIFLNEIAMKVYKSPRKYTMEELIKSINDQHMMIFIDGLDHVENYNQLDLQNYIDFISKLINAHIVVLSRPLKKKIHWKYIELINWNYDEIAVYLEEAHEIKDIKIKYNIFKISNGYPIITFYLAEHYKIHGEINIKCQIESIEHYYDVLVEKVNTKEALSLFAVNNSFYLRSEIKKILNNEMLAKIIEQFIEDYPYLFNQVLNRVSLIHDSFNTYLRENIESYISTRDSVNSIVMKSLINYEVEYMSRFSSFDIGNKDCRELLCIYSDGMNLERVLGKTLDYNSITNFYQQLQKILEINPGIFNIYQYYFFVLLYQMVMRNDLIGYEALIYEVLVYMNSHGNIEEEIFSSGIMWNIYALLKSDNKAEYKKYLNDKNYDTNNVYELYNNINDENEYFEKRAKRIEYHEILNELTNPDNYEFDKQDILIVYMVSVWVNNLTEDIYYKAIQEFLYGSEEQAVKYLKRIIKEFGIEERWANRMLQCAKYQLSEMGMLGEMNIFSGKSLETIIIENAFEGSFQVAEYVKSYIRLANHEEKEIDIFSINKLWRMYYEHKDYSVYNIDVALCVFEERGLIDEAVSMNIIRHVMKQSDKGIRHLLAAYINGKEMKFIKRLERKGLINQDDFPADVFSLNAEFINCLNKETIETRMIEMLRYHYSSKTIEYSDIVNVLDSKWANFLLGALDYYEYKIIGVKSNYCSKLIEQYSIPFITEDKESKEYVPFDHGCIHEEDFEFIKMNNISCLEVSKYVDGWYSCLPFVELYQLYDEEVIKTDYLEIIHTAIFGRVSDREYIGDWYRLIGNIPAFLLKSKVDIKWEKLFHVFRWFLEKSLVYWYE